MNFNQKVTDYISNASDEQVEILDHLRKLIHESVSGVSEEIKWGFPVFCRTKDFAYFRYAKKHLTLGFYNIEKIEDPDGLLEGSGNTLKHIKIKKMSDINEELLKEWFKSISE
ncbi:DUF1801 domain-containing protein [Brumimicrobium mesophilum]|uniref:DUF1801 domain-containing protein n=1 Tax=Brumimicrobium mesophilum TaxID=392717 RepID=UPI000D141942|nr:DUF1801 domain-containing protein [Brumimicrobium mesophilum]